MHIVHVVGSIDRRGAGVAASVCELCGALAGQARITLVAGAGGEARYPVAEGVRLVLCPRGTNSGLRPGRYRAFARVLRDVLQPGDVDLVHVHGLWMGEAHLACRLARQAGVPYVVSAHGMLMPWAFRHKRWKKCLPWLGYQRADLRRAAAMVANGEPEAAAIRAFGFPNETLLIPHGMHVPPWQPPRNGAAPRQVVFLGRLHPIKGLMNLVDAWALARPEGWRLVLAGPDEGGFRLALTERVRQHNMTGTVAFVGPMDDSQKWELLRQSDLLVLPSFTENFGLVVPEALTCGVPVLTARGTPWSGVVERRCGWWVDNAVASLADALREATGLPDAARREMGRRGYDWVCEAFAWERVAQRAMEAYERLRIL